MRNSAQERAFLRFCGNCAHTMRNSKPKAAIFAAKFQKQTKMKKYYLHITAPKNVRNIMKEGLKANADGVIHLFDTFRMEATAQLVNIPDSGNAAEYEVKTIILIGDDIAIKKGLKRYALLKISRDGINTEPTPETDTALFSEYFWTVNQPLIEPRYITKIRNFTTIRANANRIRRKGETDWFLMD